VSNYQKLLKNPIYTGLIRYNGEIFEGKHEPIITKKLFDSKKFLCPMIAPIGCWRIRKRTEKEKAQSSRFFAQKIKMKYKRLTKSWKN
jgi:hypothetical protein